MKCFFLTALLCSLNVFTASASDINYKCISDSLQSINSDIYCNLSEAEIDAMLTIPEMFGHYDTVNAAKRCESVQSLKLTCNGNLEAEFIGKVTNLSYSSPEAGNLEHTTYSIGKFSFYNVNALCPLDDQLALSANFWIQGQITLKNEDSISGVLIYNPKTQIFSIE